MYGPTGPPIRTFVPVKSADTERIIDNVSCALNISALIGVLDTENELSVVFLCDKVSIECRSEVAYVHKARRTGGKSRSYIFCIHLAKFLSEISKIRYRKNRKLYLHHFLSVL